jgi:hypothetical protein
MDYFVASGYLEDLESTVTVDALSGDIAVANLISTSNVQSSNADIGILESYSFASTLGFTSNLLSSNVQTTKLHAHDASLSNLSSQSCSGSNLIFHSLASGVIEAVHIETSTLTCTSNLAASSVLTNYLDATTILGSNVYILSQLLDRSNVPIIDSNSKIDWASLKNIPESNELDILALSQGAYDLAQLGFDMYQQLQSLLGNTPSLPDNIKDPISESLGDLNETSSNGINVHWNRVFAKLFATSNNDLGVKNNIYASDLSKMFVIPTCNFSTNNGSLYNTTATSNLLIDFTTQTIYPQAISMGSNQLSTSNCQFGHVNIEISGISTVSNVSLNIASATIVPSMTSTSNVSAQFISAFNITN